MIDVAAVAEANAQRLRQRAVAERWIACSVIWTRLWGQNKSGWDRWPDTADAIFDGLCLALRRHGGLSPHTSTEIVLVKLGAIDIDDDGSAEWQYLVDLASMLTMALGDNEDVDSCVSFTITAYLEGVLNVIANELAGRTGRPVSQEDAVNDLESSPEWTRAVLTVEAL